MCKILQIKTLNQGELNMKATGIVRRIDYCVIIGQGWETRINTGFSLLLSKSQNENPSVFSTNFNTRRVEISCRRHRNPMSNNSIFCHRKPGRGHALFGFLFVLSTMTIIKNYKNKSKSRPKYIDFCPVLWYNINVYGGMISWKSKIFWI